MLDSFLAFTPAGSVSSSGPVYANYGREEDFDALAEAGMEVNGTIVIARYGFNHRGNKIKSAEDRGAIGVLLYSDPEDCAMLGTDPLDVYPNDIFLPGTGMQRGTTKVMISGDILSSGWASIDNAYRDDVEDRKGVPRIPAQPIGYDDATQILEKLGGSDAPEDFIGGLSEITYKLGGEFADEYSGWNLTLDTFNYFEDVNDNQNVIGIIKGSEEPDRYVILCNHRDAWGFGAVDPSSGTALLLEAARVMGESMLEGWRPKRSIILASWAAEEYGVIGSTEWVYHKLPKLLDRTIAVVNVDSAVEGPIFKPSSSPTIGHLPVEATKKFSDPANPASSYYDYWKEWTNLDNDSEDVEPESSIVGSGSDHDPFVFSAGVPSMKIGFDNDNKAVPDLYTNPAYHTAYDTFHLVDELTDPGFFYHVLTTQIALDIVTTLSDAEILPFDFNPMAELMSTAIDDMESDGTEDLLQSNGATLSYLRDAVDEFTSSVSAFESYLGEVDTNNVLERRMINDQIMKLERAFLPIGFLPGREDVRHLIYSPSQFNRYGTSVFPGLTDLLYEVELLTDQDAIDAKWKEIKRHLSDLMIAVKQAAAFLEPFELI